MNRYRIATAEEKSAVLDQYMRSGYEPFAVTTEPRTCEGKDGPERFTVNIIWLRLEVPRWATT